MELQGTTAAVEFLHDRSIIHCGLRAKNVLIDQDFRPKIRNIENNTKTKNYQSEDVRHWSIEVFGKVRNKAVQKSSKYFRTLFSQKRATAGLLVFLCGRFCL